MNDLYIILLSTGSKLFTAILAFFAMRIMLWKFDRVLNFDFKEWFANVSDENKTLYLSVRLLAAAIFFAWLLS